jgi:hypothetical protein
MCLASRSVGTAVTDILCARCYWGIMPNPAQAGDGKPRVSIQFDGTISGIRDGRVAAGGCAEPLMVIRLLLFSGRW